jgi:hypothetical protein
VVVSPRLGCCKAYGGVRVDAPMNAGEQSRERRVNLNGFEGAVIGSSSSSARWDRGSGDLSELPRRPTAVAASRPSTFRSRSVGAAPDMTRRTSRSPVRLRPDHPRPELARVELDAPTGARRTEARAFPRGRERRRRCVSTSTGGATALGASSSSGRRRRSVRCMAGLLKTTRRIGSYCRNRDVRSWPSVDERTAPVDASASSPPHAFRAPYGICYTRPALVSAIRPGTLVRID